MKNILIATALLASFSACGSKEPPPQERSAAVPARSGPAVLPAQGDRISLPDGGWFTWEFTEKPKIATVIAKVKVFASDGSRAASYGVIGEYGMPSMRYHDSGPVEFKLNKRGDYLLPVEIVMPGEWQLTIRVKDEKEVIYEGQLLFGI